MLNRLLPRHVDNTYHGYKLALWLFALVVFMKVGMSLNAIFNGRFVASSADGIPTGYIHASRRTGSSFSFCGLGAGPAHNLFALYVGLSSMIAP